MKQTIPIKFPKKTNLGAINYELTGLDLAAVLDSSDPAALMQVRASALYTDEYILFKNALIDRYWYAETGTDMDEIFISKFQARWAVYAPLYARNFKILTNDNMFDKIKTGQKTDTRGTGYTTNQTTQSDGEDKKDTERATDTQLSRTDTDTQSTTLNDNQTVETKDEGADQTETTRKDFGTNIQVDLTDKNSSNTRNATNTDTQSGSLEDTKTETSQKGVTDKYGETGEKHNTTTQDTTRNNFGADDSEYTETTTYYDIEKIREIPQLFILLNDFLEKFKTLFMLVYTEL